MSACVGSSSYTLWAKLQHFVSEHPVVVPHSRHGRLDFLSTDPPKAFNLLRPPCSAHHRIQQHTNTHTHWQIIPPAPACLQIDWSLSACPFGKLGCMIEVLTNEFLETRCWYHVNWKQREASIKQEGMSPTGQLDSAPERCSARWNT